MIYVMAVIYVMCNIMPYFAGSRTHNTGIIENVYRLLIYYTLLLLLSYALYTVVRYTVLSSARSRIRETQRPEHINTFLVSDVTDARPESGPGAIIQYCNSKPTAGSTLDPTWGQVGKAGF
jgi:hypothetical protein